MLVYQRALQAAHAVAAILKRREFSKDFDLRDQLANSSSRVPALIAEGYDDAKRLWTEYDEICAMITGLIQHLEIEDRPHRWIKRPASDD